MPMYVKHKIEAGTAGVLSFFAAFMFPKEHTFTMDSAAVLLLAILLSSTMIALTSLSGKKAIQQLAETPSKQCPAKTNLGVFRDYFSTSFSVDLFTLGVIAAKNIVLYEGCPEILFAIADSLEFALLVSNLILYKFVFNLVKIYFYQD